MLDKVGGNLYPSVTMHLVQEIMKNGGAIKKGSALVKIEDGKVIVKKSGETEIEEIPCDQVILAMGVRSNRAGLEDLKAEFGDNVVCVGDASRPAQIYDALHSAYNKAFVFELR
jgi:uncharacterized FAD-dependent dehydrogenase